MCVICLHVYMLQRICVAVFRHNVIKRYGVLECSSNHSHKKRKDSLEGNLEQVLFAAELEFPKILVPRLPRNTPNENIECAGKSKQLYSLREQLLVALIYIHFIVRILICF